MFDELLKKLGLSQDQKVSPIVEGASTQIPLAKVGPSPASVQAPEQQVVDQATAAGLLGDLAIPRQANYVAQKIEMPQADPAIAAARAAKEQAILEKLNGLDSTYKQELEDAESRKLKSTMFAALGNYLPTAIAGATAMNTKANVQAPKLPTITPTDDTGRVERKYKTDYENLLSQYKGLKDKDGGLTDKDRLYASIAQAQLNARADGLNNQVETTDRNLKVRVGNAVLKDQKDNELDNKQIDSLAGYDDTLTSLERIRNQKKNVNTGPVADKRNKIASVFGVDDPEVTSLRSEVIDTLATKIKALSGTAANESEVKRLEVTLPGINDSYDVFERKLIDAEKRIKEAKAIRENHYRTKQGKRVEGYESKAPQASTPKQNLVERKSGNKIALFDAETKQFVKWKE